MKKITTEKQAMEAVKRDGCALAYVSEELWTYLLKPDVIVTSLARNYTVALFYDVNTMFAPVVAKKGEDSIGVRIREIAKKNGVPIIKNRALAQKLYNEIEAGQMIPMEFFAAVVLIYLELERKYNVVKFKSKTRRGRYE